MKTLVSLIEEVKNSLTELHDMQKKNARALKALEQEQEDIIANISMYEGLLKKLEDTKNEEISKVENGNSCTVAAKKEVKIIVVDEKGERIAEYENQSKAARDLSITQPTLAYRMKNRTREQQIKKFGFAVLFA